MLKRCAVFALALGLVFGAAPSFAAKFELKLAHSSPATGDRLEQACQIFKKFVEEKTNGEIAVTTYPASQLGGEREQAEGVQMGTIEMAILSTGPIPGLYPEIMLLDLPWIFPDRPAAFAFLDGPFGLKMRDDMLKRTGSIRLLSWGENGFRCFTANKPLTKAADFQGLKFRLMENPLHQAMVKSLGGLPSTIPFGELYTALAQGVVDGQENPLSLITSMRFYEVQKNLILDNHVYNPYLIMMNNDFYMGLPENFRAIIDEGAALYAKEERRLNDEQCQAGLKLMTDAGINIVDPSAEVLKELKEKTMPTHEIVRKRFGDKTVDEFLAAVEKAIAETR